MVLRPPDADRYVAGVESVAMTRNMIAAIVDGVEQDGSAKEAVKRRKRDCGCQATPRNEQSCQCCECKDVGVSTSKDTETITDVNMVQARIVAEEPDALFEPSVIADKAEVSHTSQNVAEAIDVDSAHVQGE